MVRSPDMYLLVLLQFMENLSNPSRTYGADDIKSPGDSARRTSTLPHQPHILPAHTLVMASSDAFDYLVIGAGSAGMVVATRLAENPDASVCIIEAGEDLTSQPNYLIPGTFSRTRHA